jgi:hypothetical protein
LREERKIRVFEKTVLRRIFGPRDEVTGDWRKLHNEKLNDSSSLELYTGYKLNEYEMGGACGTKGR